MNNLHDNINQENLVSILQDEGCNTIFNTFEEYLTYLCEDSGQLSSFWMTYIEIVEILLGLIRVSRAGSQNVVPFL